jgi:asparagine synthase (glutamine-hydrolysing)
MAIRLVDGDYAFAVWDGENLALARDPLGVKPLFYAQNDEMKGFASSRQSLKEVGFEKIETLKPEHILFNWNDIVPTQAIYEKVFEGDVAKIDKMLKLSVAKRIDGLSEVGVIFSGGLDSSYIALLLKEISENIPLKITLYAVGAEGSKDVEAAIYASKFLNLDLKICEVTEELVREALPEVVKAIGDDNLMKVGVGLTTYFATKMVAEDGLKVAFSGQGADELFGGYKRYLQSFVDGTLNYDLRVDMSNMYHVNLERDDACSMLNGVELRLPFLDKSLVELVLNIQDNKKIVSMHDDVRKSILRKLAFEEGLDYEIAYRPKKAAQYGTGIDKILRKKIIKDTDISQYLSK